MLSRIDIISQPSCTSVPLSELKSYIRFYDDSDDLLLQNFLWQATELAEQYLGRKLFNQTLKWTTANSHNQHNHHHNNGWMQNGQSWGSYWHSWHRIIELPITPIQEILAVSYGQWNEADTFLTAGVDYYSDISTDPARIKLLSHPQYPSQMDHMSVVMTTGYAQTSNLSTVGTATAAGTVSLTLGSSETLTVLNGQVITIAGGESETFSGGQAVTVTVSIGDTAQTFTSNAYAAVAGSIGAEMFTPSMIGFRGSDALVTVNNQVSGLTVSASTPVSSIPQSIRQAILAKAANEYRAMGRSDITLSDRAFYRALDPWRFISLKSA